MPETRLIRGKHLTLYSMQGNLQTEEFADKRLQRDQGGTYMIETYKEKQGVGYYIDPSDAVSDPIKKKKADTCYIMVIMPQVPDIIYVRKYAPGERGHSSIAIGQRVIFAGEGNFNDGQLKSWNNNTGHYKVGMEISKLLIPSHIEKQTQFVRNLLPMEKFIPYKDFEC